MRKNLHRSLRVQSLDLIFKSVHYADQAIGQFMTELDNAGLLDNTVVVYLW